MAHRIVAMGPELGELALEIVRWVEDYQPGIVACEFVDADGRRHTVVGKVPIFNPVSHRDDLIGQSSASRQRASSCSTQSNRFNRRPSDKFPLRLKCPPGNQ